MSNKNIYLKLNNYDYSKQNLDDVKNYLEHNIIPTAKAEPQQKIFIKRYKSKLFNVKDNKLFYTPLNLECVESDASIIESKLKTLYDDNKIGTGMGIKSFYNKVIDFYLGIKRETVREFLMRQEPYQLRKSVSKPINKPIICEYPNQRWAVDCIDLTYLKGFNKQKLYIMTVIDFFSKYVFAVPLANKKPKSIIEAFNKIGSLQSQNIYPNYLQCDNGGEFKNQEFKTYCDDKDIKLIFTKSYTPTTNGLIENFNKYLRKMIFEGFIRNGTAKGFKNNWINYLDDYLYNRNHTKHSVTKQNPVNVWKPTKIKIDTTKQRVLPLSIAPKNSESIQQDVLKKLQTRAKKLMDKYEDTKLFVGDQVRISTASIDSKVRKLIKADEAKKVILKFTKEIYTVTKVINPNKPFEKPTYQLNTIFSQDKIKQKRFYANELQKINNITTINE